MAKRKKAESEYIVNFRDGAPELCQTESLKLVRGMMQIDRNKEHPCMVAEWLRDDAPPPLYMPVFYDPGVSGMCMLTPTVPTALFFNTERANFLRVLDTSYSRFSTSVDSTLVEDNRLHFKEMKAFGLDGKLRKQSFYNLTSVVIPALLNLRTEVASERVSEFERIWQRALNSFFIVGNALDDKRTSVFQVNDMLVPAGLREVMLQNRHLRCGKHDWLSTQIYKYVRPYEAAEAAAQTCSNLLNLAIDTCTAQMRVYEGLTLNDRCFGAHTVRSPKGIPTWDNLKNAQAFVPVKLSDHIGRLYGMVFGGAYTTLANDADEEFTSMLDEKFSKGMADSFIAEEAARTRRDFSRGDTWVEMIKEYIVAYYTHYHRQVYGNRMATILQEYKRGNGKFGGAEEARNAWFEKRGINKDRFDLIRNALIENPDLTPRQVMEQGLA